MDPPSTPSPRLGSRPTDSVLTNATAYAETFFWIRNKAGRLVPLQFNPTQRYIRRRKREALRAGKRPRFLIPKARRMGVTTQEQAYSYALCALNEGQQAVTIADTKEKTARIFEMVQLFYERTPEEFRPERRGTSGRLISFANLESQFFIGTAGAVAFGRGDTLQKVHGSEVAWWLKGRDQIEIKNLVVGLTEAASHGEVTLESTAHGAHGWWYDTCMEAAENGNEWTLIFCPWFMDPTYRIGCSHDEADYIMSSLDDRESMLVEKYKLDAEQIKWRRAKANELKSLFPQEYPEILEESFIVTSAMYFDLQTLTDLNTRIRKPLRETDTVRIWKEPVEGHRYIAGADVAEGVPGGDYSVLGILDHETGEQVATIRGLMRPEEFAKRACRLCVEYNTALLAIERNNHGHSALNTAQNAEHYPNLFYRIEIGDDRRGRRSMGWDTNSLTRPIMLDDLRNALDDGHMKVNDRVFVNECRVFEDDGSGRYEARPGHHDDCIIAWAIAWQARMKGVRSPGIITL